MSLVQFTHRPTATSIFDELFHPSFFPARNHAISEPAVNVQEGEKGFTIELAVPGKSKNDFEIELDQEVLTIAAEGSNTAEESTDNFSRKEFNYASFKRSFTLPDTIDTSKISAKYTRGILRVDLPKRKEALPQPTKRIAID